MRIRQRRPLRPTRRASNASFEPELIRSKEFSTAPCHPSAASVFSRWPASPAAVKPSSAAAALVARTTRPPLSVTTAATEPSSMSSESNSASSGAFMARWSDHSHICVALNHRRTDRAQ
jgi:hypothetical protein